MFEGFWIILGVENDGFVKELFDESGHAYADGELFKNIVF